MKKIKFMRYTANGAEYVPLEIPQEFIDKYSTCDVSSVKQRMRFWNSPKKKNDWGCHIVGKLLTDSEFVDTLTGQINPSIYKWFSKSFNNFTTNFYVLFNDLEASAEVSEAPAEAPTEEPVKEAPVEELVEEPPVEVKKERKKREKKPVDPLKEARKVYRTAKTRLNNKIRLLKTLNHWVDPYSLSHRGDVAERERADNVLKNIFNAYKVYFEEGLAAKGVPFYITKEGFDLSNTYRNRGAQIYAQYVLVNNTENVPDEVIRKQSYNVLTLAWCFKKNMKNRWNYERVMTIDKIGITIECHDYVRRGRVKSFEGLRESTFTEMVEKVFNANNQLYASKIEDFKSLQTRVVQNQVEENKLKDFLTKNVISVLNPTYLKNSALDFTKEEFEVAVPLPRTGWTNSEIEILNVRKKMDDLENMTIRLTFFGRKTKEATTAAEAISFINAVFQNDLAKTVDIISRSSII